MAGQSRRFVGRQHELNVLMERWEEAKKGNPQAVALVAETGFGKTRIIREFYEALARKTLKESANRYWPASLDDPQAGSALNPAVARCGLESPEFPYLWWAIQLPEPYGKTQIASALRPAEDMLAAHLERYARSALEAELTRRRLGVAREALNSVAVDTLGAYTFGLLGLVKTFSEASVGNKAISDELEALRAVEQGPAAAAARQHASISDVIVSDLAQLCHSPPKGLNALPIILVIDDLQWLDRDPALGVFVEKLIDTAGANGWPLLVLITCWEREWHDGPGAACALQMTSRLRRLTHLSVDRLGEAFDLVAKALPGLTPPQQAMLVERADGNVGILDELLGFLEHRPRLFVDRDLTLSLTESGEALIRDAEIKDLMRERLHEAPLDVQSAVALASIQGLRFQSELAILTADKVGMETAREALVKAERPHAIVRPSEDARSEFRLRAYWQLAQQRLEDIFDPVEARSAYSAALDEMESRNVDVREARVNTMNHADGADVGKVLTSLIGLMKDARDRLDLTLAGHLAGLWSYYFLSKQAWQQGNWVDFDQVTIILKQTGRADKAQGVADALLVSHKQGIAYYRALGQLISELEDHLLNAYQLWLLAWEEGDHPDRTSNAHEAMALARRLYDAGVVDARGLRITLQRAGDVLGDAAPAELLDEQVRIAREAPGEGPDIAMLDLYNSLSRKADRALQDGDLASATAGFREMIDLLETGLAKRPSPTLVSKLADARGRLAQTLFKSRDRAGADIMARLSIDGVLATVEAGGDPLAYSLKLARTIECLSGPVASAPGLPKIDEALESGLEAQRLKAETGDLEELRELAAFYNLCGLVSLGFGRKKEAVRLQRARLEISRKIAAQSKRADDVFALGNVHNIMRNQLIPKWHPAWLYHRFSDWKCAMRTVWILAANGYSKADLQSALAFGIPKVTADSGEHQMTEAATPLTEDQSAAQVGEAGHLAVGYGTTVDPTEAGADPRQMACYCGSQRPYGECHGASVDLVDGDLLSVAADILSSKSKIASNALMQVLEIPEAGNHSRNGPCWCGSGRRYKHCHGSLQAGS